MMLIWMSVFSALSSMKLVKMHDLALVLIGDVLYVADMILNHKKLTRCIETSVFCVFALILRCKCMIWHLSRSSNAS